MTNDERLELTKDASTLAYTAIRFTGLYRELAGSQWDELAEEFAVGIVAYIEGRCDTRLAIIEAAKESANNRHTACTKAYCDCTCHTASTRVEEPTPGGDGRYCTHHDDDPAHGKDCYEPDAESARVAGEPHQFVGESKSIPCKECGLIYSASIHHASTSDSARRAAEGIADYVSDGILGMGNEVTESDRTKFLEIVNRAFAAAPAANEAESLTCVCPITPSERCQIHAALVAKGDR